MSTGLAIISNGNFPTDCLSFSNYVAGDSILHAARISSDNNNYDVSGNDHSHQKIGDIAYTSEGINNGVSGDAYIQTDLESKLLNSFTLYSTFKLALNSETAYSSWAGGNYVDLTVGGWGLYIRSESDPENAGNFRIVARASMTRKRVSDGVFSFTSADLVLLNNLATLPTVTPWFVLAMEFDLATRTLKARNLITGAVISRATTDAEWVTYTYDSAQRNAVPASIPKHRLMYAGSSSLDNNNSITLGESFCWSRLLTDAERAEQLEYSRSFMSSNRGVTLP